MVLYCDDCGAAQKRDTAKFCYACGTKIFVIPVDTAPETITTTEKESLQYEPLPPIPQTKKSLETQEQKEEEQNRILKEKQEQERIQNEKEEQQRTQQENEIQERMKQQQEEERNLILKQNQEKLEKQKQEEEARIKEEKERIEKQKQKEEEERIEKEKQQQRIQQEKIRIQKIKEERLKKEQEDQRIENQRIENERIQNEKIENERIENERIQNQRIENQRIENERKQNEKIENERLENERIENERIENERIENERIQNQRIENQRIENQRKQNEKIENERLENQRIENQRIENEKIENQRIENEKIENERIQNQRIENERIQNQRIENERIQNQRIENERIENQRIENEKQQNEKIENEKKKLLEQMIKEQNEEKERIRIETQELKNIQKEKEELQNQLNEIQKLKENQLLKEQEKQQNQNETQNKKIEEEEEQKNFVPKPSRPKTFLLQAKTPKSTPKTVTKVTNQNTVDIEKSVIKEDQNSVPTSRPKTILLQAKTPKKNVIKVPVNNSSIKNENKVEPSRPKTILLQAKTPKTKKPNTEIIEPKTEDQKNIPKSGRPKTFLLQAKTPKNNPTQNSNPNPNTIEEKPIENENIEKVQNDLKLAQQELKKIETFKVKTIVKVAPKKVVVKNPPNLIRKNSNENNLENPKIITPHITPKAASFGMAKPKAVESNSGQTNISNLGGKDEKDARKAAALLEPAFQNLKLGRNVINLETNEPCMTIFRIEKMKVVPLPLEEYSKFSTRDAYIVLKICRKHGNVGYLKKDIHFWIGLESSQDSMAVAAYKTVELDDVLDGQACQHREVEEHESDLFISYFPLGVEYVSGGIGTGLKHHVKEEMVPKLFQLRGKINIRVKQVKLHNSSLNNVDVFILDCQDTIYQWHSKGSTPNKRRKAMEVTNAVKEERHGKSVILPIDQGDEPQKFWEILGEKILSEDIPTATTDDLETERAVVDDIKLYQVIPKLNDDGTLFENDGDSDTINTQFNLIATGFLNKSILQSDKIYILDNQVDIFIWIGTQLDYSISRFAMKLAGDYMSKFNLPFYISVTCILEEGQQSALFNQSFQKRSGAARQLRESYYQERSNLTPQQRADLRRSQIVNQKFEQRASRSLGSSNQNQRQSTTQQKPLSTKKLKVGEIFFAGMDQLASALSSIFRPNCFAGWVLVGYSDSNTLVLQTIGKGSGYNSVNHLLPNLKMDQIQYILLRIPDSAEFQEVTKDVFITWLGSKVRIVEKGRKKSHAADVMRILRPFNADLEATSSNPSCFNEENIRRLIQPGSGSHVISE